LEQRGVAFNGLVEMGRLDHARELAARESGLAVVVTSRADGSVPASVVNAGVLHHPVTGDPVVGFVARGGAKKLGHLRMRPRATVVFRSGWDWVAVEGDADLVGPDDHLDGLDAEDVPLLLREVYAAAVGGTQDQWTDLDATMAAERHTAVLIRPVRVYSNPGEPR
jgi:PPOX class probable F420-dependent enzyme